MAKADPTPKAGTIGPPREVRQSAPYLPPHGRGTRMTLNISLPAGVRRGQTVSNTDTHEYLQHDGQWKPCGGRGRCRECNREEAMKSTKERLQECLTEHFGYAHLAHVQFDEGLFDKRDERLPGRQLGDEIDKVEMLIAIEQEFQIQMPPALTAENPTINYLAAIVDDLIAAQRA